MELERRRQAFTAVDRWTELPMMVLAVAMVPLILAPLLLDLSAGLREGLLVADWTIWAVFALELAVKTYLAPARVAYLRQHWFDVLIVVVPFLRPLRVIRSARALRLARVARLASFASRSLHSARAILSEHGLQWVLLVAMTAVFGCGLLVYLVERDSGGPITSFGDGLWWAVVTVTTVGYGDKFPVTAEGRGIAVLLMLVGITLFGLITANVAAFLIKPAEDGPTLADLGEQLRRLEAKVDELAQRDET